MTRTANLRCAFNRLVIGILALTGLIAGGFCFFAPDLALGAVSGELSAARLVPVASLELAAVAGAAICAVVLVLEILGDGGSRMFEAVIDGGAVEYPADVITYALESDLEDVDGIEDARVRLAGGRRNAIVYAILTVDPTEDSQSFAARASGAIHGRLESLGLETGYLRLTFRSIRGKGSPRDHQVARVA
ncbi:MAG: hypothetical protein ACRDIY_23405 [Chloroflexota bacterium]